MKDYLNVISLGAGVQSSTLLLMSCRGEIEKADCAIFADTQGEPPDVYEYLEFLRSQAEKADIPVYVVSKGSLEEDFMEYVDGKKKRASMIPLMLKNINTGKRAGFLMRQCTVDYKIMAVRRKAREIMKQKGYKKIRMNIGISTDEIMRMKPSRVKYVTHHFPLVEMDISRQECIDWYSGKDYPVPPASACYYCPYHTNEEWKKLKSKFPDLWERAVEIDNKIRSLPNVESEVYLHTDRLPLEEAIKNPDSEGLQLDMFNNECEGMCGL